MKRIYPTAILLSLFLMLLTFHLNANDNFRLSVELPQAANGQVLLAHYYGGNLLVDDTLRLDAQGRGEVRRDTLLPEGIYKLYFNQEHHFDFLLGAQQELHLVNPTFSVADMRISGPAESEAFLAYMHWLNEQQQRRSLLEEQRQTASPAQRTVAEMELEQLNRRVINYWLTTAEAFPGSFLSAFLLSNYYQEPFPEDIPETVLGNDSLLWHYRYNHRKDHFFDYFDLTDERLLYTPVIKAKFDAYFLNILIQQYDSLRPSAYRILSLTESSPLMFRFAVSYLLNYAHNSRVMGMDALFADIARDYYLTDKTPWMDENGLAIIKENLQFIENNLIGMPAVDFQMENLEGDPFRLYQLQSKYTVVIFYEPNCGHCREYLAGLYKEIYLPYRDKGFDVVAVYSMTNRNEWKQYIDENGYIDWHNIWDEHHLTRFRVVWDTRLTPSVYLLNEDKQIVAKKFSLDYLHFILPQVL